MIINDCVCCVTTKTMKKAMSLLLMLVMLGVFIQSSHALKCYECENCELGPDTPTCEAKEEGKCYREATEAGAFIFYRIK